MNGLDRIVDEYIKLMDDALGKDDINNARDYLRKGKNVNSNQYAIEDAEKRLNAAVEIQENKLREKALIEQEALQRQQNQQKQKAEEKQAIHDEAPLISDSDKQKLEQLKRKLRANPKDRKARRELRTIADTYQKKIESTIKDGDFGLAEEYVSEVLKITPKKSKAYKDLTDLLGNIRDKK